MRTKAVISIMMLLAASVTMAQGQAEVPDTMSVTILNTEVAADTVAVTSITLVTDSLNINPVDVEAVEVATDTVIAAPQLMLSAAIDSMMLEPIDNRSIYCYPYSMTLSKGDWKRMWTNTCVLSGAFVGTLLVLECLPPDATAWNRAEIRNVPLFRRWYNHVIKQGPEWDHDNPIFNYILHPYAGAAYFMACRSTGFNFWQSLLYSATVSTVGWEFGIEAFMERPSIQDLFITPCVGSVMGELFYKTKRSIVANDYELAGSKVLGNIVVFLVDPVNEVVDLFRGRNTRCATGVEITSQFTPSSFSVAVRF